MDLGLSDGEFYALTPRLLFLLLERSEEMQYRADLRAGLLASLLFNPNRKKGMRAMTAQDFFPKPGKQRKQPAVSTRRKVKATRRRG